MSILVDEKTRIVVMGITGKEGSFHTKQMLNYGSVVAAGVTPGKKGQTVEGVPVFNTIQEAVRQEGVNASCIFVPPLAAADAIMECASAGLGVVVCITEGIPALDMVRVISLPGGQAVRPHRPELPGHHLSWQDKGRNHAGAHSSAGKRRGDFEKRDSHLRSGGSAHQGGSRAIHVHRHRRGFHHRHLLHRPSQKVQRRSRAPRGW